MGDISMTAYPALLVFLKTSAKGLSHAHASYVATVSGAKIFVPTISRKHVRDWQGRRMSVMVVKNASNAL
jgi:hypothetical protein